MPGRSHRSARVVIMDDISWSEPTPRSRRAAAELAPPQWLAQEDPHLADLRPVDEPGGRYRVDDYLDDGLTLDGLERSRQAAPAGEPPVIEYVRHLDDDEEIWGPRPKLMADDAGGRRTVVITGRGAERQVAPHAGSRHGVPVHARHGFPADRTAMWAVLLCVILLLVAVTSH